MSEFKASNFRDEFGNAGPDLVGITTMTSPYYFVPPSGSTAERPSSPSPGMLRFNTDIGRLEVWRNDHWATILGESPNLGNQNAAAAESPTGTGTRGLYAGVQSPTKTIGYITIETLGNIADFGDLNTQRHNGVSSNSSRTRAIFGGGVSNSTLEFVTFASTGNGTSFGNLVSSNAREGGRGLSNSTRGIQFGGFDRPNSFAYSAEMGYITMASTGNAQDFGDLSGFSTNYDAGINGSVRGVLAGSGVVSNTAANVCHYVTMSTTGNTQNFGDLTVQRLNGASGASSATRGVIAGGRVVPGSINNIEFITIASTGNAQDFGDLTAVVNYGMGGSSTTRGIFTAVNPAFVSNYVTIASTGDGTDFGEIGVLTLSLLDGQIASNGHGGL
jgi:hypothetical protein